MIPTDTISQVRWLTARNLSGRGDIPAFAIVQVDGCDPDDGTPRLIQPTVDNSTRYLHVGPEGIASGGQYGVCTRDLPNYALYETMDGTPALGDIWGVAAGGWKLRKANTGYRVLDVYPDAELAMVQRQLATPTLNTGTLWGQFAPTVPGPTPPWAWTQAVPIAGGFWTTGGLSGVAWELNGIKPKFGEIARMVYTSVGDYRFQAGLCCGAAKRVVVPCCPGRLPDTLYFTATQTQYLDLFGNPIYPGFYYPGLGGSTCDRALPTGTRIPLHWNDCVSPNLSCFWISDPIPFPNGITGSVLPNWRIAVCPCQINGVGLFFPGFPGGAPYAGLYARDDTCDAVPEVQCQDSATIRDVSPGSQCGTGSFDQTGCVISES